jgi:HK97 family phage prohead protease
MRSHPARPTPPQTIDAPPLFRIAEVRADSINEEARTAEVVWTTGARVLRGFFEKFYEELSLDPKHVNLRRLKSGRAPVLDSHNSYELRAQIGVVESAALDDGRGIATIRFAKDDEDADRVWNKVAQGIVRNVSVGYRVHKLEKVEESEGKIPVMRATSWEPYEISLVPMGADEGAKVRGADAAPLNSCVIVMARPATRSAEESTMPDEVRPTETAPAPPAPARHVTDPGAPAVSPEELARRQASQTEQDRGVATENRRALAIMKAVRHARLSPDFAEDLIKRQVSIEDAQNLVLEEMDRRGGAQAGPTVYPPGAVTVDTLDHVRSGIANAMLNRIDAAKWPLTENGRAYAYRPLITYAETCLQARGLRTTGKSPMEIAGLAFGMTNTDLLLRQGLHTIADFPLILADVANKQLRRVYDEAPQTFVPLTTRVPVADFKTINSVQLGDAPALLEVGESGEVQSGTMGEGREQYALRTYARIVGLSRQAIVNDDLMAFARIITNMGRAARNLESNLAWTQITSNPTMGDGVALFHATHANLITGPGTAIDVASLGVAREKMRVQKGIGSEEYLNLTPRYLACPPGKETLAQQYTIVTQGAQILTPSGATSINPFAGQLTVLAEPRLTGTAWYLFADTAQIDIIAWAVLQGQEGPVTETEVGFRVEGMQIKVRHDVAMKVLDFRGAVKNDGA